MNSYERVLACLNHSEPDQIPFDLGGTPMTGIHITAYHNLRRHAGITGGDEKIEDIMQQLAYVDENFHQYFRTDVRKALARASDRSDVRFASDGHYSSFHDVWGIGWRMPEEGGFYYDMYSHPLQEAESIADIKKYQWPDPLEGVSFAGVREKVMAVIQEGYMPVIGGFCPGVTTMHAWLRGFENFYMDFILNPAIAEFIMDKVNEIKMTYWASLLSEVKDLTCIAVESDDLGSQKRTLYSPETYRKFVKPRHTQLMSFIKSSSSAKVFLHSCGAIRSVLGDLIEAGVDIINPVQKSAAGMDPIELKRDFGNDVVFWGGGVDTQNVLSSGSPGDVKDDVKRSIDALAPGGGFIFAAVHNIQANVPPENIIAMWQTLKKYEKYY